jgi:hypothetical protein
VLQRRAFLSLQWLHDTVEDFLFLPSYHQVKRLQCICYYCLKIQIFTVISKDLTFILIWPLILLNGHEMRPIRYSSALRNARHVALHNLWGTTYIQWKTFTPNFVKIFQLERMVKSGHTYAHTYIHTYIQTPIHTYVHTYIHTPIHTLHTYIHTYTHIDTQPSEVLHILCICTTQFLITT